MAKLSVACCDENFSRQARREELLQLQVDIVRIIEEQEPVSVGLVCKPTQTRINGSLGISWGDGFEICLKCLFTGSINIEDVGEAMIIIKFVSKSRSYGSMFDGLAYRLFLDSSMNLNASWLFPAPPRPCSTKMC